MHCGVGDYCAGLIRSLRHQGIQVAVFGSRLPGPVRILGGGLQCPPVRDWRIGVNRAFFTAIRRLRPHLVHFQYPTQGYGRRWMPWLLPILGLALKVRIVITWHEYIDRRPFRQIPGILAACAGVAVRPLFRERLPALLRTVFAKREIAFIPGASAIPRRELNEDERMEIVNKIEPGNRRVIAYFGFTYPAKGTHRIFEILDPEKHHLLIVGGLDPADPYQRLVLELANSIEWRGSVSLIGFQAPERVAALLAASDAALLPFSEGGGIWNSSIHAAVLQGTLVVTTSREGGGYDAERNIFFAQPDDISGMSEAIEAYMGRRGKGGSGGWQDSAVAHIALYRRILAGK